MTKDNKTTTSPPKKPATGAVGGAAPRKKLTLNTTAFQKKLLWMRGRFILIAKIYIYDQR